MKYVAALICLAILGGALGFAWPAWFRKSMAQNEHAAINACKQFANAEDTYRRKDYNGNEILEYATTLKQLADAGLINMEFANAEAGPNAIPKDGYFFKVLTGQSEHGPGGKRSYLSNGLMTVGYALFAFPAQWDKTGRNCFMISSSGTIYQHDYGGDTAKIAAETTEFEPIPYTNGWGPAAE